MYFAILHIEHWRLGARGTTNVHESLLIVVRVHYAVGSSGCSIVTCCVMVCSVSAAA